MIVDVAIDSTIEVIVRRAEYGMTMPGIHFVYDDGDGISLTPAEADEIALALQTAARVQRDREQLAVPEGVDAAVRDGRLTAEQYDELAPRGIT